MDERPEIERPMDERPEIDWPAIRTAYEESDVEVDTIAARHGIHRVTLYARAKKDGWTPRSPSTAAGQRARRLAERQPTDLARLVEALRRTTARLVTAMEARLGTAEGIEEKDARALGALAGALAKVIALNPEPRSGRDGPDPQTRAGGAGGPNSFGDAAGFDADKAFEALCSRMERLAAERQASAVEPPDPAGTGDGGQVVAPPREA